MLPQGEKIRRAVRWISAKIDDNSAANLNNLISQAISNFDLNPKESEELMQFYRHSQQTR
jgi:hypothetical protein